MSLVNPRDLSAAAHWYDRLLGQYVCDGWDSIDYEDTTVILRDAIRHMRTMAAYARARPKMIDASYTQARARLEDTLCRFIAWDRTYGRVRWKRPQRNYPPELDMTREQAEYIFELACYFGVPDPSSTIYQHIYKLLGIRP